MNRDKLTLVLLHYSTHVCTLYEQIKLIWNLGARGTVSYCLASTMCIASPWYCTTVGKQWTWHVLSWLYNVKFITVSSCKHLPSSKNLILYILQYVLYGPYSLQYTNAFATRQQLPWLYMCIALLRVDFHQAYFYVVGYVLLCSVWRFVRVRSDIKFYLDSSRHGLRRAAPTQHYPKSIVVSGNSSCLVILEEFRPAAFDARVNNMRPCAEEHWLFAKQPRTTPHWTLAPRLPFPPTRERAQASRLVLVNVCVANFQRRFPDIFRSENNGTLKRMPEKNSSA